jgi:hypothetical protein
MEGKIFEKFTIIVLVVCSWFDFHPFHIFVVIKSTEADIIS